LILSNQAARNIAISGAALHEPAQGPCNKDVLYTLIKTLGYVQQDPLQVVARAHDHILWSRNNQYRPELLERLMQEDRLIFEHFCHDACVLPIDILPYWSEQFKRRSEKNTPDKIFKTKSGKQAQRKILERIKKEGELCSKDFKTSVKQKSQAVWSKPEHKQVLDYLWLNGKLAVSRRVKFAKYYDLAERIYPCSASTKRVSDSERIEYLAFNAIERLGYGTSAEIMRFWEACSLDDIKSWCKHNDKVFTVSVESASGELSEAVSHQVQATRLAHPPTPSKRLRIINPFDPIVRDRKRLLRLFGFDFRIEIYIPPAKREYGYYVYPLMEFNAFVGRIEVRHDKNSNTIVVDNLWHEPGVKFGKSRMSKLESELQRLMRFCDATRVVWSS